MTNVANTILNQLGANRFISMTGAKMFVGGSDMLMFSLPARSTKNGINKVRITLLPNDTYKIEFMKIRGTSPIKMVSETSGVYADTLRQIFTNETGLYTNL
jgi:hypothetical protein